MLALSSCSDRALQFACRVVSEIGGTTLDADDFLTPQQLSAVLQVPVMTMYEWRCRGDAPPALRVGRHLRYRRTDMDEGTGSRITDSSREERVGGLMVNLRKRITARGAKTARFPLHRPERRAQDQIVREAA